MSSSWSGLRLPEEVRFDGEDTERYERHNPEAAMPYPILCQLRTSCDSAVDTGTFPLSFYFPILKGHLASAGLFIRFHQHLRDNPLRLFQRI